MMSLEIKEAIQIAREQFKLLLPELVIGDPPPAPINGLPSPNAISEPMEIDIRLEELERDGDNWVITLSVPNPNFNPNAFLEGIRNARHLARIAKVIVIDGKEGQLLALRERAA
jgi:hypothetical protein